LQAGWRTKKRDKPSTAYLDLFLPKLFVYAFLLAREALRHVGLGLLCHHFAASGAALCFQVLKEGSHWRHVV
jgi:hypothetical protein